MKKLRKYFSAALLVSGVCLTACNEEAVVDKTKQEPKVLEFVAPEALLSSNKATLKAKVESADKVIYAFAAADAELPAQSEWTEVEVSDSNTVEINLSDLTALTPYQAALVAINSTIDKTSVSAKLAFTTTEIPYKITAAAVDSVLSYNKAQVKVTVLGLTSFSYTYYLKGERPADAELTWVDVETTNGDGDYLVDITGLPVSLTDRALYEFEVVGKYDGGQLEPKICRFQTTATDVMRLSNEVTSPFNYTLDIELVKEFADGFFIYADDASWYDKENYLSQIKAGWLNDQMKTQDSTYTALTTDAVPGAKYKVLIQPVRWNDQKLEIVDAAKEIVIDFPQFKTGMVDLEGNFFFDKENITVSSLTMKSYRTEGMKSYFWGAISKEELATTSITDYINNSWYAAKSPYPTHHFDPWSQTLTDTMTTEISGLLDATAYYVFALPVDMYGFPGKAVIEEVTTKSISINENVVVSEVAFSPKATELGITVTFGQGVSKAYCYRTLSSEAVTLENAFIELKKDATAPWGSSYEVFDGEPRMEYGLEVGTSYDVFVMAISDSGEFGKVEKHVISTLSPTFNSSATVEITQGLLIPNKADNWKQVQVPMQVTLGNGAVGYHRASLDSEYIRGEITPELVAKWAFGNGFTNETYTEVNDTVTFYTHRYMAIYIPVDAAGEMGTPILVRPEVASWPFGIYHMNPTMSAEITAITPSATDTTQTATVEVTLGEGAVGYYVSAVDRTGHSMWTDPETLCNIAYVTADFGKTILTETTVDVVLPSKAHTLVLVPVNQAGDWGAAIEVKPSTSEEDGEGGMGPR